MCKSVECLNIYRFIAVMARTETRQNCYYMMVDVYISTSKRLFFLIIGLLLSLGIRDRTSRAQSPRVVSRRRDKAHWLAKSSLVTKGVVLKLCRCFITELLLKTTQNLITNYTKHHNKHSINYANLDSSTSSMEIFPSWLTSRDVYHTFHLVIKNALAIVSRKYKNINVH